MTYSRQIYRLTGQFVNQISPTIGKVKLKKKSKKKEKNPGGTGAFYKRLDLLFDTTG